MPASLTSPVQHAEAPNRVGFGLLLGFPQSSWCALGLSARQQAQQNSKHATIENKDERDRQDDRSRHSRGQDSRGPNLSPLKKTTHITREKKKHNKHKHDSKPQPRTHAHAKRGKARRRKEKGLGLDDQGRELNLHFTPPLPPQTISPRSMSVGEDGRRREGVGVDSFSSPDNKEAFLGQDQMCVSREKLTRSSSKGFLDRALFAYKNGRFASSFLLLGAGLL